MGRCQNDRLSSHCRLDHVVLHEISLIVVLEILYHPKMRILGNGEMVYL